MEVPSLVTQSPRRDGHDNIRNEAAAKHPGSALLKLPLVG